MVNVGVTVVDVDEDVVEVFVVPVNIFGILVLVHVECKFRIEVLKVAR